MSAPRGTAAKLPIYLKQWETITADPEVLAIVKGIKIPLVQKPHQALKPVTTTTLESEKNSRH